MNTMPCWWTLRERIPVEDGLGAHLVIAATAAPDHLRARLALGPVGQIHCLHDRVLRQACRDAPCGTVLELGVVGPPPSAYDQFQRGRGYDDRAMEEAGFDVT